MTEPRQETNTATAPGLRLVTNQQTGLGAVFTRRWIVELVLDLAGYTVDADLAAATAIEPACGHGAFVEVMVERLLDSCAAHNADITKATAALTAVDIDPAAVQATRDLTRRVLIERGVAARAASRLARTWIREGDFLRTAASLPSARWVVGNPPYVRIEDVAEADIRAYREAWSTMSGRADLYVGFYQAALERLEPEGRLSLICPDRWMRNRYGAGLRRLVEEEFSLDACIVMHEVDAFEDKVAAYPAITVIRRGSHGAALTVEAGEAFGATAAQRVARTFDRGPTPVGVEPDYRASWVTHRLTQGESWPAGTPEQLALLADLEARFPTLEMTGAHVSVGVATGAEDVYVISDPDLVEPERRIPTLGAKETTLGGIAWRGRYLINPWEVDGLVDLADYPLFAAYMRKHRKRLEQRHVAQRAPQVWWRTIDRIDPSIAARPKLLVPDLKERIHPVLDQGGFLPLHNTYYVTSESWDLAVLGGLLLSEIANLFVEAYSVRMANGYMRVSAQYLRRVRLPRPADLTASVEKELCAAFWSRDIPRASKAAERAYGCLMTSPAVE
jgi:adenine-specific DNA-methyltransferase